MSQTAVYGIFGWPVEHSRSPRMQNAAFAACAIDATYVAFPVAPEALPAAVAGARALGIRGLNVTLPHKAEIMPLLDEVDALARAIGAVNTVIRTGEDRLCGTNTDAQGLARSLAEGGVDLAGKRVAILGAGGAVRAAVVGLAQAGAHEITVAARRPDAAEALVHALQQACSTCHLRATGFDGLTSLFADVDLLVQGTSATLGDQLKAQAFADQLPIEALPAHATVTDLVYTPRVTTVMARAEARGLATVDGSGMLIHQGALAFEHWTQVAAPVGVMRTAFWNVSDA